VENPELGKASGDIDLNIYKHNLPPLEGDISDKAMECKTSDPLGPVMLLSAMS
jgi:hypothetical protein